MRALFFFFVIIVGCSSVSAQTLIGKIVDQLTGEPLDYANIKVIGKDIGSISYSNGEFDIQLPSSLTADSLRISYIGYHDRTMSIADLDLDTRYTIKLEPLVQQLSEVEISVKQETEKLGNMKVGRTYSGWGDLESLRGRIIGTLIDEAVCPVKAKSFAFRINHNEWDSVRLRLNFLEFKDGHPGSSILSRNIFITTSLRHTWVTVNLADYDVIVCNKTMATVEWVDAWGKTGQSGNRLTISNSKNSGYTFRQEPGQQSGKLTFDDFAPAMYLEVFKGG